MMSDFAVVGFVKALIILDNDGRRLFGKYYSLPEYDSKNQQKVLEKELYMKSSKQAQSKTNDADIFHYEDNIVVYRPYLDFTTYVIGDQDDNELVLASVLEVLHECFDNVFSHKLERKKIIDNMPVVILIIDELIENGTIISSDSTNLLSKLNIKKDDHASSDSGSSTSTFASVFAHARNQIAKSLQM